MLWYFKIFFLLNKTEIQFWPIMANQDKSKTYTLSIYRDYIYVFVYIFH